MQPLKVTITEADKFKGLNIYTNLLTPALQLDYGLKLISSQKKPCPLLWQPIFPQNSKIL